jgi:hypothetical protein
VQASLMKQHAHSMAAEAFVESRLGDSGGRAFGALELESEQLAALVEGARLQGA